MNEQLRVKMMKEEKFRRFYIITQTKRAKKNALTMNTRKKIQIDEQLQKKNRTKNIAFLNGPI